MLILAPFLPALPPQSYEIIEDTVLPTGLVRLGERVIFTRVEVGTSSSDVSLNVLAEGDAEVTFLYPDLFVLESDPRLTWRGLAVRLSANGPLLSDGTAAGTFPAIDFPGSQAPSGFQNPAALDTGLIVFRDTVSLQDPELYFIPEPGAPAQILTLSGVDQLPSVVHPLAGGGLFRLDRNSSGWEWWFTDGSETGTAKLLEIAPASADGVGGVKPVIDGGTLYFEGITPQHGRELWSTDGTAPGTQLIADVEPGPDSSWIDDLQLVGDRLVFRKGLAPFGTDGVWSLDRATGSFERLDSVGVNAAPVPTSGLDGVPDFAFLVERTPQPSGPDLARLWSTRGTPATTELIDAGLVDVGNEFVQVASDGTFLFSGSAGPEGLELWRTDGTSAGTAAVLDVPGDNDPLGITLAGDRLVWRGRDGGPRKLFAMPVSELGLASIHPLGVACPSAAKLTGFGLPAPGAPVQFDLTAGTPGQPNALLLGRDLLPPPAIGSCALGLDWTQVPGLLVLDGAGAASLPVTVPASPALVGETLRLQAVGLETGGPIAGSLTASGVLEVFVGP